MKIRAGAVVELVVNLLLPWLAYRLALPHWGELGALYASAVPPVVWSLVEFARTRRVDALSILVLLGIVLSIVLMALGGSPRLLLMRESMASGAIGVVFLVSLVLRRPLTFYLARATVARKEEGGAERFEALWKERPALRRSVRLMTAVWGLGLAGENALRAWLAWHWPVERFLVVSPFIGYAIYGALTAWTLIYRRKLQRRGTAAPTEAVGPS
ncbi:VC0807 family protein [Caballeronia sp. 15715]|uniref:VC0807 family protein n=1 Tax=unclassified Caballeronia TaxID=2646786 RepID=UPI0039E48809